MLKRIEQEAAVFVEYALAVLDVTKELNRSDLAAGDAGVARILGHAHAALHAAGLSSGDVTGISKFTSCPGSALTGIHAIHALQLSCPAPYDGFISVTLTDLAGSHNKG
nr:hypothetical protein [Desulfosarcina ovata]